jgi:hypothetical protein
VTWFEMTARWQSRSCFDIPVAMLISALENIGVERDVVVYRLKP